jgi:hypothetical protein
MCVTQIDELYAEERLSHHLNSQIDVSWAVLCSRSSMQLAVGKARRQIESRYVCAFTYVGDLIHTCCTLQGSSGNLTWRHCIYLSLHRSLLALLVDERSNQYSTVTCVSYG